ncbi:hypothetical protein AWC38_SpisGene20318 [Stylophora pistillata]|uniref:Uncharacterized protein n=1 Tax=Stylophora pistillata TaxID=50429 RepID=A0A2B4RF85_STYPI|nr:hypothetical protein AWC38_SpisGene20318 [Stylophora pistillata]
MTDLELEELQFQVEGGICLLPISEIEELAEHVGMDPKEYKGKSKLAMSKVVRANVKGELGKTENRIEYLTELQNFISGTPPPLKQVDPNKEVKEEAMEMTLALDIRQQVLFALQTEGSTVKYEPSLAFRMNGRNKLRPFLQKAEVTDEELVEQINVVVPEESEWKNKLGATYHKNARVNFLEVDSDQAESDSLIQSKKSVSKKEMKCDRPDRLLVALEAVQSDIAILKEVMASQNASHRERESSTGTHLKIKGDVSAKHAKEQTKSFVTIVSAVAPVIIFPGDVAAVQPVYQTRETGGGYHRWIGSR